MSRINLTLYGRSHDGRYQQEGSITKQAPPAGPSVRTTSLAVTGPFDHIAHRANWLHTSASTLPMV